MSPLIVVAATIGSAHALPPQSVAPVKLPHGARG
ncbi:2-oxoglutarate dehydrogenase, partial [Burkholderia multivorans]